MIFDLQTERSFRRVVVWLAAVALQIMMMAPPALSRPLPDNNLVIVTFGTSLSAIGGWKEPLQRMLEQCLETPVTVVDRSRVGETSAWGLGAVDAVIEQQPDIVLIEFAANDAALNRFISRAESTANMQAIAARLTAALPDVHLYFQAMSPAHGLKWWARPFLGDYVEDHLALARKLGIGVVDHRPYWSQYSPADLDAIMPDGNHPKPELVAKDLAANITDILMDDMPEQSACKPSPPGDSQL